MTIIAIHSHLPIRDRLATWTQLPETHSLNKQQPAVTTYIPPPRIAGAAASNNNNSRYQWSVAVQDRCAARRGAVQEQVLILSHLLTPAF